MDSPKSIGKFVMKINKILFFVYRHCITFVSKSRWVSAQTELNSLQILSQSRSVNFILFPNVLGKLDYQFCITRNASYATHCTYLFEASEMVGIHFEMKYLNSYLPPYLNNRTKFHTSVLILDVLNWNKLTLICFPEFGFRI